MPERVRVAAVVLAAGSSTRMGRNKLLLDLGGEIMVRRAVRAAVGAGVDEVVAVLGHDEPLVRAELAGLPCTLVVNPDHAQGAGRDSHLHGGSSACALLAAGAVAVAGKKRRLGHLESNRAAQTASGERHLGHEQSLGIGF